ncbi:MAG: hypothetical protein ABI410_23455 [Rhodoferax sp.]|uniref:hypothetical protein n=1 Tax=Rhodoferax sp. TaxID=50421 RepID=UPI003262E829
MPNITACGLARLECLFHFQINTRLGAKPQTVVCHGKAKQRHIRIDLEMELHTVDVLWPIESKGKEHAVN